MKHKNTFLLIALVLTILACDIFTPHSNTQAAKTPNLIPSRTAQSTFTKTKTPQPLPTAQIKETQQQNISGIATPEAANSLCTNEYFPVVENATWFYLIEDSRPNFDIRNNILVAQIAHADSNGFYRFTKETSNDTVAIVDDPSATSLQWFCRPDGLASTISGPEGIFLPSEIPAGTTWKEAIGTHSETTYTSLGVETITLPVFTYVAVKVQAVTNSSKEVITFLWYVKDVGIVKTLIQGPDYVRSETLIIYYLQPVR